MHVQNGCSRVNEWSGRPSGRAVLTLGMPGVVVLARGSWSRGAQGWMEWVGAAWDPPADAHPPPPWVPLHGCPHALQGRGGCMACRRFQPPKQQPVQLQTTIPKRGTSCALACPSPRRTPEPLHVTEKSRLSCKFGYHFFTKRYIKKLVCVQDTSVTTLLDSGICY